MDVPTEFLSKLAEILQADQQAVGRSFPLTSANWDSLAVVSAILLIDEVYSITIPAKSLAQCTSVGALLDLVLAKVAEAQAS
jgi:acyl carrier protein